MTSHATSPPQTQLNTSGHTLKPKHSGMGQHEERATGGLNLRGRGEKALCPDLLAPCPFPRFPSHNHILYSPDTRPSGPQSLHPTPPGCHQPAPPPSIPPTCWSPRPAPLPGALPSDTPLPGSLAVSPPRDTISGAGIPPAGRATCGLSCKASSRRSLSTAGMAAAGRGQLGLGGGGAVPPRRGGRGSRRAAGWRRQPGAAHSSQFPAVGGSESRRRAGRRRLPAAINSSGLAGGSPPVGAGGPKWRVALLLFLLPKCPPDAPRSWLCPLARWGCGLSPQLLGMLPGRGERDGNEGKSASFSLGLWGPRASSPEGCPRCSWPAQGAQRSAPGPG